MAEKKRKAISNARQTKPTAIGSIRSAVLATLLNMSVTVVASTTVLLGLIAAERWH